MFVVGFANFVLIYGKKRRKRNGEKFVIFALGRVGGSIIGGIATPIAALLK
jgi:hypothetical protein